ncbi:flagellar basal body P-ring formation chaperone FlgA [Tardiphaga sp.]|uniref:flagellar basal body P-ring formation chaperone FlgA n=1 Tax=Tardiphaga sp. TaxID=1926292 RepID=UPI00260DBB06|nr:flagellar basal body P-ring formation chaperone FlgA [Tardiphaga sp.]MDB5618602.1 flagellar protein FlgA [Tardiphaga sp.]
MKFRSLLLATTLLAFGATAVLGQSRNEVLASPVLRANVTVSSDVVRIGDVIDNAGPAAPIAIYRAPDLGTVGSLPVAKVIAALRAHQVIGVDTRELTDITVTRLSRSLDGKEIENQVALALAHRNGLGDAANLTLTFDRDVQTMQLDAATSGALEPVATRFDARSGRFDITFAIGSDTGASTKLRFTGTAVETVEAAVLARSVDSKEVLKASDVVIERRPKSEVGNDVASRDRAVGMQVRRQLRSGQALRIADLAKPDLVTRDQAVTLVYESSGLYLTIRGKAIENGTEGDVVNVINLQSKRTVSGVVVGRGQVAVAVPGPRLPPTEKLSDKVSQAAAPVAIAANESTVSRKAE